MGGFDIKKDSLIVTGNKEAIRDRVRRCITEAAAFPYIVGSANTAPASLSYERIRWVREALDSLA
jgi:hypothetical protein